MGPVKVSSGDEVPPDGRAPTESTRRLRAGQWQREQAASLNQWRRSGASLALPQLATLCQAVNGSARRLSTGLPALGANLQPTRACCDDLLFQDYDEAAAYMVQHLADRYGRVTQVLELLFTKGHLPIRRRQLSVLEIGAGPAPGLYAARDFYADLNLWVETTKQEVDIMPVTRMHALDRGIAWGRLLHSLSENLIALRSKLPGAMPLGFESGVLPFGVEYNELVGFSTIDEHRAAFEGAVRRVFAEFDRANEGITESAARQFARDDGVDRPSAYDLVITCNFLTTEESLTEFRAELRELAKSLTPGGLLIVIGHPPNRAGNNQYARIWSELRTLMCGTRLTELRGFEDPITANDDPAWSTRIRQQRQEILDELRSINALHARDSHLQASDRFSPFQVSVWKDQHRPRKGRRRRAVANVDH